MTNKEIVRRYFNAKWNDRNPDVVATVLSPDIALHGPAVEVRGLDEYQEIYRGLLNALGDTKLTMEELIQEDDKVVSRIMLRGTHCGDLLGLPATGKAFRLSVVTIFRLENELIVEEFQSYDALDMLTQLGMSVGPP